jgi:hypothetical protein
VRKMLIVFFLALSVLPALAADDTPQQIGAFLAYCKSNSKGCTDKIMEMFAVMLITAPIDRKWCPGNISTDETVVTPLVLKWLTAHPEVNSKSTNDGIGLAFVQLYPCK